jgi:single-stranded DNA-binding protein
MITNQTLSVVTKKGESNLFNFYAINGFDDRFQPAKLIADYTKKGTGLTIEARIVTDSWTDKETKEQRTLTKLQLINMTLAPKGIADQKPVESKANVAGGQEVTSLWGGRTGDPEEQEVPSSPHQAAIAQEPASDPWKVQEPVGARGNLPDLPGAYGPPPTDDENAPF